MDVFTMIGGAVCVAIGIVVGVLFGRKNVQKVESIVMNLREELRDVKRALKDKIS